LVIDADANKCIVCNVLGICTGQTISLSACHYLGTLDNDLKPIPLDYSMKIFQNVEFRMLSAEGAPQTH